MRQKRPCATYLKPVHDYGPKKPMATRRDGGGVVLFLILAMMTYVLGWALV